jgi:hypothetical protein
VGNEQQAGGKSREKLDFTFELGGKKELLPAAGEYADGKAWIYDIRKLQKVRAAA